MVVGNPAALSNDIDPFTSSKPEIQTKILQSVQNAICSLSLCTSRTTLINITTSI